jgi:hypothetical protein
MSLHRNRSLKITRSRDVRPPNPPWIRLEAGNDPERAAALSFYYSDSRSKIPVREVSHKNEPKGDPNIETKTFGLFSHCDKRMRATMVRERINLHFFCTSRADNARVLTGYYHIGWYYKIPRVTDPFVLAAKEARFVRPGFPLQDLPPYLRGKLLRFRIFRYLDKETADLLLLLIKDAPDATSEYVSEIHRLERLSLKKDGYLYRGLYPNGFSWDIAPRVMKLKQ